MLIFESQRLRLQTLALDVAAESDSQAPTHCGGIELRCCCGKPLIVRICQEITNRPEQIACNGPMCEHQALSPLTSLVLAGHGMAFHWLAASKASWQGLEIRLHIVMVLMAGICEIDSAYCGSIPVSQSKMLKVRANQENRAAVSEYYRSSCDIFNVRFSICKAADVQDRRGLVAASHAIDVEFSISFG